MPTIIVAGILLLILAVDGFFFCTVTDLPLGLTPADLSAAPRIQVRSQPSPVAKGTAGWDESFILVPAMTFQPVQDNGNTGIKVMGFGRAGDSLYLQLRLYESLDLSLKKGWGKAIQLIDSGGKHYLFDSYSLPSGVQLHDPLVDLPDDLRCRQTILEGGYKDLYLPFPGFPHHAVPRQVRIIEAFQGNSPANPGIVYQTVDFSPAGKPLYREAVKALKATPEIPEDLASLPLKNGLRLTINRLEMTDNLFPLLSFTLTGNGNSVYLTGCVLVDRSGANYNLLRSDEKVFIDSAETAEILLLFERLPETAAIGQIWFHFSVDGTDTELTVEIPPKKQ